MSKQPVMLCILDGWGLRDDRDGNAIEQGCTPNWHRLVNTFPWSRLEASGEAVGLPEGQMGNSEVGHLNIGAGRIVYQDLTRIDKSIRDGDFFENPVLREAMQRAARNDRKLHLMGLVSDGGVHSHLNQLKAMVDMAKRYGVRRLYVHGLLDGRDVPPRSALTYIGSLEEYMEAAGLGRIATISGRYYTMDRDKRWDRVQKGYDAMVRGVGQQAATAAQAVQAAYDREENDEFVLPTVVDAAGLVEDGDSLVFFNFRADRAREITRAFIQEDFDHFALEPIRVHYVCLTEYDATFDAPVAFPPEELTNTLGQVLAREGRRQLRIAETEKYAHVTFFFNGGVEQANPGEDRELIPSPKVRTYDLQPEMSARQVTDRVVEFLDEDVYDVIILNFANPDMVGHTGVMEAAREAVATVDGCLQQVLDKMLEKGGTVFVTADHGNAEQMVNPETGNPHTAHTNNLVPFMLVSEDAGSWTLEDGSLRDIAPTMLEVLNIRQPGEMTGRSLLRPAR